MLTKLLLSRAIKGKNAKSPEGRERVGVLSGAVGIALNTLLFAAKLSIGVAVGLVSVTADAFNNLSDSFSSVVSLVSFRFSGKEADEKHPFGHERLEYVASMVVAFVILLLAWELGSTSVKNIVHPPESVSLGAVSGVLLGVSVLAKLWMFAFNRTLARAINSDLLRAAAADSVSDAAATLAVILCAVISRFTGFNLDGYAGLLVALFILKAGIGIVKESGDNIIGTRPDAALTNSIVDYVKSFSGVLDTHDMIIHQYGPNRAFLSLHVEVDGRRDIFESHDMIDNIESGIKEKFGVLATIHLDPVCPEDEFVLSLKQYALTELKKLDERLSVHDFRVVKGETHTNVLFDVTRPHAVKLKSEEIKRYAARKFKELDENYFTIIVVDSVFT